MPLDFHFNDPMTSESESLLIDKTTTTTGDKLMQWNSSNVQTNFTNRLLNSSKRDSFILSFTSVSQGDIASNYLPNNASKSLEHLINIL